MNESDLIFRLSDEKTQSIRRGFRRTLALAVAMLLLLGLLIFLAETTKLLVKAPVFILFPIWIVVCGGGFFSWQRLWLLLKATRQVRLGSEGLLIKSRLGEKSVAYSDIDQIELRDEMDFEDRRFCRLALKGQAGQDIAFVVCDLAVAGEIAKLFEPAQVGRPVSCPLLTRLATKLGQLTAQWDGSVTLHKGEVGCDRPDDEDLRDDGFDSGGPGGDGDEFNGRTGSVNPLLVRALEFADGENLDPDRQVAIFGVEYLTAPALEECRPMSLLLRNRRGRKLARIDNQLEDFSTLNRTLRSLVDQAHGRTEAGDPLDRAGRLRRREKQSRLLLGLGLFLLGLSLVVLVWGGYDKWQYRRLQEHGLVTQGTVTRLYHPTIIAYRLEYEFKSEQGQRRRRDVLMEEEAWRGLSVGDQLTVKYLPPKAAVSCVPGEADGEPSGWFLFLIGLSMLVPGCMIYMGWKGLDWDRVGSRLFRLERGELPEDKI